MDINQEDVNAIFDEASIWASIGTTQPSVTAMTSPKDFVGSAIHRDHDRWIVATKVGRVFHGPFDRTGERSAKYVRAQLVQSLDLEDRQHRYFAKSQRAKSQFLDQEVKEESARRVVQRKVRFGGNAIGHASVNDERFNLQAE